MELKARKKRLPPCLLRDLAAMPRLASAASMALACARVVGSCGEPPPMLAYLAQAVSGAATQSQTRVRVSRFFAYLRAFSVTVVRSSSYFNNAIKTF